MFRMLPTFLLAQENSSWHSFGNWVSLWAIVALLLFVFWLFILIDCMNSSLPTRSKILWIGMMFLFGPIGSGLFLLRRRSGNRPPAVV